MKYPNMTEFLFTIANFGYQFTELELKNTSEKVSLETLQNWKKDNQTKKKYIKNTSKNDSKTGGT